MGIFTRPGHELDIHPEGSVFTLEGRLPMPRRRIYAQKVLNAGNCTLFLGGRNVIDVLLTAECNPPHHFLHL